MERGEVELEDVIVELCATGQIALAAKEAIDRQLADGLAVTYRDGDRIVKLFPDGHIQEISDLPPRKKLALPETVRRIEDVFQALKMENLRRLNLASIIESYEALLTSGYELPEEGQELLQLVRVELSKLNNGRFTEVTT